jgi:hypothetical protein
MTSSTGYLLGACYTKGVNQVLYQGRVEKLYGRKLGRHALTGGSWLGEVAGGPTRRGHAKSLLRGLGFLSLVLNWKQGQKLWMLSLIKYCPVCYRVTDWLTGLLQDSSQTSCKSNCQQAAFLGWLL